MKYVDRGFVEIDGEPQYVTINEEDPDTGEITFTDKKFNKGQIIGGLTFGLGWALSGACPGPMEVNIGPGYLSFIVVVFFALVGTYLYGVFQNKLPH